MKAHGWQVSFANSPAISQTTLSSVKVCLSLRLTAVMLYGMTFVQSLHMLVSSTSEQCMYFVERRLTFNTSITN